MTIARGKKFIFELLTELERDSLQETWTNTVVSVQKSIGNVSDLLTLLRSDIMCDAYQLCFIPCEKNWARKRRAHSNFMLITVGKLFEEVTMYRQVSTRCYCVQFRMDNKCQRHDAVMNKQSNLLRIQSIEKCCATSSNVFRTNSEWDTYTAQMNECDEVDVVHVFLRRALAVTFRTSSIVSIYNCFSVHAKALLRRVQYMIFKRNAGKRMLCIHSTQVVKSCNGHVANEMNIVDGSGNDVVVDDEEDNISRLSKLPRSSLTCESDENAVRNLILSTIVSQELDVSKELESMIVGIYSIESVMYAMLRLYVPGMKHKSPELSNCIRYIMVH